MSGYRMTSINQMISKAHYQVDLHCKIERFISNTGHLRVYVFTLQTTLQNLLNNAGHEF